MMGEPQGCHRKEQTIRLLTVPNNVTLNGIAGRERERDMQRKEEKEREKAWGKLVYTVPERFRNT